MHVFTLHIFVIYLFADYKLYDQVRILFTFIVSEADSQHTHNSFSMPGTAGDTLHVLNHLTPIDIYDMDIMSLYI